MSLTELIQRIREGEKTITTDERKERLIKARILNAEGCFDAQFFPSRQTSSDSKNKVALRRQAALEQPEQIEV